MFVLYVISVVGLVAAMTVSLLSSSAVSRSLSYNRFAVAQSEAAQEAAVARAVLGLIDARIEHRWRVGGVAQPFVFGGTRMLIAIQDELGRIDLNHADQTLLASLFRSTGLDDLAARRIADRVLAWRDPTPGLEGEIAYRQANLTYAPRRGPMQSVDELKLVLGVSEDLYQRVKPALTVYSGQPRFDPTFAPPEALSALGPRGSEVIASRTPSGEKGRLIPPSTPLRGRAFSIEVQVENAARHEIVVRLTDQVRSPFWVLSWQSLRAPRQSHE